MCLSKTFHGVLSPSLAEKLFFLQYKIICVLFCVFICIEVMYEIIKILNICYRIRLLWQYAFNTKCLILMLQLASLNLFDMFYPFVLGCLKYTEVVPYIRRSLFLITGRHFILHELYIQFSTNCPMPIEIFVFNSQKVFR